MKLRQGNENRTRNTVSHPKKTTSADKPGLRRRLIGGSIWLTSLLCLLYLYSPLTVQHLNLKVTDLIQATSSPPASPVAVEIVAIDDRSLRAYGQWPWPRYRLEALVRAIRDQGAGVIGLTIILSEQDRTSPRNWLANIERDFGLHIETTNIPQALLDHDALLATTLAESPAVLSYSFLFDSSAQPPPECSLPPTLPISEQENKNIDSVLRLHEATSVVCNLPIYEQTGVRTGFLNCGVDNDGVLRRIPLLIKMGSNIYPAFPLSILLQDARRDSLELKSNLLNIPMLHLGEYRIPLDGTGNFALGPPPAELASYRPVSAADVLQNRIDPGTLTGKIVIISLSGSGLTNEYATALGPSTPLPLVQKYMIESLTASHHTIRNELFPLFEAGACLSMLMILAFFGVNLSSLHFLLTSVSLLLLSWLGAIGLYHQTGMLLSPLLPSLAVILNAVLLLSIKTNYSQKRARADIDKAIHMLRSSEANLQSIIRTIPDIVFRLDHHGRITFISDAIAKYISEPDTVIGKSVFELIAPEDLDKARFRINERRTGTRATQDLELRLQFNREPLNSNEQRYFSISAEGIYGGDTPNSDEFLGTQGIVKDITDRKRLENRLIQARKMEAIGNLAAGIAHDLNNILSGLVSYPDLLLMEIDENDPLYEKILIIQKSGKRAAAIVQDLLTLARRNIQIDEICNINQIIRDYLGTLEWEKTSAKFPRIQVVSNLDSELLNVRGSSFHLSKVIMNSLLNALEAMPAGGRIVIETGNVYIDHPEEGYETIPEGEYARITVTDNGVGIRPDDLKRIFEPFYTNKAMCHSGTGLGMTVIWATVKDHKGFFDLTSTEGIGTSLAIYLPATREQAEQVSKRIVLDDYLGSESILVVDDIADQLDIARNMLEKLGYTVHCASSGEQGVAMMQEQHIDLIVLDMIMPGGMDGLETYQQVLLTHPTQKAIITSGYSESERVKKLQTLGAGSYVQKPYSMESLGIAVRRELDRPITA